MTTPIVFVILIQLFFASFNNELQNNGIRAKENRNDTLKVHPRIAKSKDKPAFEIKKGKGLTKEMVWIPAGEFMMGGNDELARPDELPRHRVIVDGFWMDETEITNAQFREFVKATGYITTAEKKPDWEELKKQLPPNAPKPDDSILVPGSLVFTPSTLRDPLSNVGYWWSWVKGANWQHPFGPGTSIEGKDNYPIVHVSWYDANAYCEWAGKRLPTEAGWEWASRGGLNDRVYPWGDEHVDEGEAKANTWQGTFPNFNNARDGFHGLSPVKSFQFNGYGLYDISGNVWEWTADWYHSNYYAIVSKQQGVKNPKGPDKSFDPMEPTVPKRVQRGGSFLCNDSYCSGYRVSARMKASPDTGLSHSGFRCVVR